MTENKQKKPNRNIFEFINNHSKVFIIATVIIAGIGLSAFLSLWWTYKNVAAIVGNELIMKSQVERQLVIDKNIAKTTQSSKKPTYEDAKAELIADTTIIYAAADNNITINQDEVDAYIKALADSKYDGSTNLLYQAYNQAYGYTETEYRNQVQFQILKDKVSAKLVDNVSGSYISTKFNDSTELENFSKTTSTGLESWAKAKSESMAKQIAAGKNFNDLYKEVQNEKTYPLIAFDQGSFTEVTRDTNKFGEETLNQLMKTEQNQLYGPVKDGEKYTIFLLESKNNGKFESMKALVDRYKADKALIISASVNKVKSLFVQKAYACYSCNANNTICALFYCNCGSCHTLCGSTTAPRCPAGQTCSLSNAICRSGCGSNNCGGGGGGTVTPPPQPVNGKCGSTSGDTINWDNKPNSGLCSYGSASSVNKAGDSWKWSCSGSNGGSTSSCSANIAYRMTVDYEGCGYGTVKETPPAYNASGHKISCDPNHGGAACFGWFTRDSITLMEKTWNDDPVGGFAFLGWEKLWSGAKSDDSTVNITLGDNKKIKATFGYSVKLKIAGKGKVVDNRDPHKIICENSNPGTTKTCRDAYYGTGLKLVASVTDSAYPFTGWITNPGSLCSGTDLSCNLNDRCKNTEITAGFGTPPVSEPSCNATPISGTTPLVVKLNASSQRVGESYKFKITGPGFTKEVAQNGTSAVYFTAPNVGTYNIILSNSINTWSTTDCPVVTVKSPTSNSGGEVAP